MKLTLLILSSLISLNVFAQRNYPVEDRLGILTHFQPTFHVGEGINSNDYEKVINAFKGAADKYDFSKYKEIEIMSDRYKTVIYGNNQVGGHTFRINVSDLLNGAMDPFQEELAQYEDWRQSFTKETSVPVSKSIFYRKSEEIMKKMDSLVPTLSQAQNITIVRPSSSIKKFRDYSKYENGILDLIIQDSNESIESIVQSANKLKELEELLQKDVNRLVKFDFSNMVINADEGLENLEAIVKYLVDQKVFSKESEVKEILEVIVSSSANNFAKPTSYSLNGVLYINSSSSLEEVKETLSAIDEWKVVKTKEIDKRISWMPRLLISLMSPDRMVYFANIRGRAIRPQALRKLIEIFPALLEELEKRDIAFSSKINLSIGGFQETNAYVSSDGVIIVNYSTELSDSFNILTDYLDLIAIKYREQLKK